MKSKLFLTLLSAATVLPADAQLFTIRNVPAGFNAATYRNTSNSIYRVQKPVAVDFMGDGKKQWYAGGTVISRFPEAGVITLPSYTLPQWTPSAIKPLAGIPIDVDDDGDLDIFRINEWDGMSGYYTMSVFINQGGPFTLGWRHDYEHNPSFNQGNVHYVLQAGDFDRDGDQDLAILTTYQNTNTTTNPDRQEGSIAIRWNDGSGQFASSTTLQSTGFRWDSELAAADLDYDGDIDLACNMQSYSDNNGAWSINARLFDNNGSGTFTALSTLSGWGMTAVDLNRDGAIDLANAERVTWNNKTGAITGGFNGSYPWAWHGSGVGITSPADFTDANGDGHFDMIYAESKNLVMRTGNSTSDWSETIPVATLSQNVVISGSADSDNDGDHDLFVALQDGTFVFMENRSHHWAPDAALIGTLPLDGVTQMDSADFNRDGVEDLVAVTPAQNKLWFFQGNTHLPSTPLYKNTQSAAAGGVAISDVDQDGFPDVAYTLPSAGTVRWARNNGPSPHSWTDTVIATGLPGVNLIIKGQHGAPGNREEFLTSSSTTGQLRWHYRIGSTWNGQNVMSSLSPAPQAILAHNFTTGRGDEPFCLSSGGGNLRILGYQLSGAWSNIGDFSQAITSGSYAATLAAGDMNGDGDSEIVMLRGDGNPVVWTPGSPIVLNMGATSSPIRAIQTVDWDRDGRLDVLCATANGLSLYSRKPGWQRTDIYTLPGGFTSLKVMDINRDGFPDVVAATGTEIHFIRNLPRVLRGTSTGAAEVTLTAGQTGVATTIDATHPGRGWKSGETWVADMDAAVTGISLQLNRAVLDNGVWKPGTALTQAEFTKIASGISLVADDKTIGTSGPNLLTSNGVLPIAHHPVLGNIVPIPGGSTKQVSVRINLLPGAAQAPVTKFFVSLLPLTGRVLDGKNTDLSFLANNGASPATLVNVISNYTAIQQWRIDHFGNSETTGNQANEADYDNDGVSNLVEYVIGTSPTLPGIGQDTFQALTLMPLATPQSPAKCRLLTCNGAWSDPKLRLTIQVSSNLNSWTTVASRTGGGAWSSLQPDSTIPANGMTTCQFTTSYTPQNTSRLFFRLQAEELP